MISGIIPHSYRSEAIINPSRKKDPWFKEQYRLETERSRREQIKEARGREEANRRISEATGDDE